MTPDGFKLDECEPTALGSDDTGVYIVRTNQYTTISASEDLPDLRDSNDWLAKKPEYPVIGGRPKSEKERRKAKLAKKARRRNRR